jgi:hypothetical protein
MRRNLTLARRARAYGMQNSLRIILEARRVKLPVSLALALFEQESGGRNVFGHDPTIFTGAGTVTKAKYAAYKRQRGPSGRGGMQGVGPGQLTWWATQDAADRLGGCWKPKYNIRVALQTLASNIAAHGYVDGIMAYNGSGPAAVAYSASVRSLAARWHRRLS